ncbi:OLC1v1025646C2 [Oldenlandia corymbosa var. corymbosa]|uniref:OLC1v1025646C2 n=1 Tax=Oldenlandia corymbosa var. corymbosa TaxID=529605 RepID=A0AAV1C596_OLDCO|nr:OLC1v1025646C2 [Oldenlandia corymbosa var. corymbosa]
MFYSQFILAKKGPLGTIWIAAHLERKLRKNQVADTDIGVSVDSILFPDVPIALRLSSHLLLGVVRIYSRKVNYLFDDCSEALLKVKQAFRSTAVDLPPEESKAPYHSITLPETFDLDDFELPDNEIFQGNFVDHHISSREQITLQDNMEGVVYSTSQFGLDERFGDGDTSGLDLDEELLMGKIDGAGFPGVSADPQTSFNSMTQVKVDEHDEGLHASADSQMENVVEDIGRMDYAQAPSTPGLVEEPNLSNIQETSCCDDHNDFEDNHMTDVAAKDSENASIGLIPHHEHEHVEDPATPKEIKSDGAHCNAHHTSELEIEKGFSPPTEDADKLILTEGTVAASASGNLVGEIPADHDEPILADKVNAASDSHEDGELNKTVSASGLAKSNDLLSAGDSERPSSPRDAPNMDFQAPILRPCNGDLGKGDPSHTGAGNSVDVETCDKGEICNSVGDSELKQKENIFAEPSSLDVCAESVKSDTLGNDTVQGDTAGTECPAPEKMLSLPEGFSDQPSNLLMESTPLDMAHVDESDAGSRIVSGKKRSYTESTLTEQSLNSVESSRAVRMRKTAEAIPDDDDLLSSILVGRRSSALKVKPTPRPGEITSLKRHRTAPRTYTSKRKVLMDDTMVLHGDTIRQQLMSTEDIRRLRKKAPCTRPEIAMIQRQFLEDQMFREPILSGVSPCLASLHSQTYDLSGIRICKDESNILVTEPVLGSKKDASVENISTEDAVASAEPASIVVDDRDGPNELETVREDGEQRSGDPPEFSEVKLCGMEEPTEDLPAALDPSRIPTEPLQGVAGSEIGGSSSIAEAAHPLSSVEIGASESVSNDIGDGPSSAIQRDSLDRSEMAVPMQMEDEQPSLCDEKRESGSVEMEAPVHMDEPVVSCDERRELECADVDASMMHGVTGKPNDNDDTVYGGDFIASDETGHGAGDGVLQESSKAAAAVAIDRETNGQVEYTDHDLLMESETDINRSRVTNDGRFLDGLSGEESLISCSSPAQNLTSQASPLPEVEDYVLHEHNHGNVADADISSFNVFNREEQDYSAAAHDTEFLNVDDDEVDEVTDDYIPEADEVRFTENTGWSSRTRAVGKYLQTLFVKEAEYGRKAIPMDGLLVGKSRKEASRMFFEALVLKTRDYIHVEQQCPFDNIIIKPKTKLVKSDF